MMFTVISNRPISLFGRQSIGIVMSVGNLGELEYTITAKDVAEILEKGLEKTILDILTFSVKNYHIDSKYRYLRGVVTPEAFSDDELLYLVKENKEKYMKDIERITNQ